MATIIQEQHHGQHDRNQRWARFERAALCDEPQRLTERREQVTPCIRAIGRADHFVDLERGVRRNGTRMAGAIEQHRDTIRPSTPQAGRSATCRERSAKAARVGPKMQATIACVSG